MNEKNKKIIIPIITILVIFGIICYTYFKDNYMNFENFPSLGLEFYYNLQNPGYYVLLFILFLYLSINICSIDYFKYHKTKLDYMIIARIGYKKYFLKKIKKILITSFLFRLLSHIVLLVVIDLFFIKIHLSGNIITEPILFTFSNSILNSLIIYIIYSCIGFSIFSIFMYSIFIYIKNIYLYRVISIIIGILGYILTSIIYNSLYTSNLPEIFIQFFCYIFFTGSFIAPGLDILSNGQIGISLLHSLTIFSYIILTIISVILLILMYRKER